MGNRAATARERYHEGAASLGRSWYRFLAVAAQFHLPHRPALDTFGAPDASRRRSAPGDWCRRIGGIERSSSLRLSPPLGLENRVFQTMYPSRDRKGALPRGCCFARTFVVSLPSGRGSVPPP